MPGHGIGPEISYAVKEVFSVAGVRSKPDYVTLSFCKNKQ